MQSVRDEARLIDLSWENIGILTFEEQMTFHQLDLDTRACDEALFWKDLTEPHINDVSLAAGAVQKARQTVREAWTQFQNSLDQYAP